MNTPSDADSREPLPDDPSAGPHEPTESQDPPTAPGPIVAGPGRYYRNARYLMVLICFGMAAWFGYDGFVRWPAENEAAREKDPLLPVEKLPHSDTDILLQRVLAALLPFAGAGILARALFHSRGRYRLEDDVLYVPGHPPIPLANVRLLDKERWEKKGIAYVDYALPGGAGAGRATLDDFVYERNPTDAIVDRIEAVVGPAEDEEGEAGDEGNDVRRRAGGRRAGRLIRDGFPWRRSLSWDRRRGHLEPVRGTIRPAASAGGYKGSYEGSQSCPDWPLQ